MLFKEALVSEVGSEMRKEWKLVQVLLKNAPLWAPGAYFYWVLLETV